MSDLFQQFIEQVPDSSVRGYLAPTSQYPMDDTDLDHLLHDLFTGLSGIDPKLVRPRWQNVPGNMPAINTEWIAQGIVARRDDTVPSQWYDPDRGMILVRQQEFDVKVSCYGDRAGWLASLIRDGIGLDQNRFMLRRNDIGYVGMSSELTVPVLLNERWYKKIDFTLTFRRFIGRVYPVLNILSATGDIIIDAQDHEVIEHIDVHQ